MSGNTVVNLRSNSARFAVAVLAVDNIKVPQFGIELLKQREDGVISYDEAREAVRIYARKVSGCVPG